MSKRSYTVTGMSCAACSARVEKAVRALPDAGDVSVNLLTGTLTLTGKGPGDDEVVSAVKNAGYGAFPKSSSQNQDKGPAAADGLAIGLSGRGSGCRQRDDLKPGMILQQKDKALSDHAGCADDAYTVILHGDSILSDSYGFRLQARPEILSYLISCER